MDANLHFPPGDEAGLAILPRQVACEILVLVGKHQGTILGIWHLQGAVSSQLSSAVLWEGEGTGKFRQAQQMAGGSLQQRP